MRVLTKEQYDEIRSSKVYQMIMNAPPPDHTVLNRDAEIFAKWIARIHKKERARMNASSFQSQGM